MKLIGVLGRFYRAERGGRKSSACSPCQTSHVRGRGGPTTSMCYATRETRSSQGLGSPCQRCWLQLIAVITECCEWSTIVSEAVYGWWHRLSTCRDQCRFQYFNVAVPACHRNCESCKTLLIHLQGGKLSCVAFKYLVNDVYLNLWNLQQSQVVMWQKTIRSTRLDTLRDELKKRKPAESLFTLNV